MGASPSDVGFRANPAERPMQSRARLSLAGTSGWFALFGALLIHASILSFLLFENKLEPAIAPEAREIPVEILVAAGAKEARRSRGKARAGADGATDRPGARPRRSPRRQ